MRDLNSFLRPFLALSLFLTLAIGFRSFLITNVIEPIAALFWAVWRIVSSVNQTFYWMILIFICLILMMRFIPFGKSNSSHSAYNYKHSSPNRVEYWRTLMINAALDKDEAEYLRDNLNQLLTAIDQLERSHPGNLDETVMPEQTSLPIAVQRFLFSAKGNHKMWSGDYRLRLLFITPGRFRRWAIKFIQPDHALIEETLTWMETTMEISHDR